MMTNQYAPQRLDTQEQAQRASLNVRFAGFGSKTIKSGRFLVLSAMVTVGLVSSACGDEAMGLADEANIQEIEQSLGGTAKPGGAYDNDSYGVATSTYGRLTTMYFKREEASANYTMNWRNYPSSENPVRSIKVTYFVDSPAKAKLRWLDGNNTWREKTRDFNLMPNCDSRSSRNCYRTSTYQLDDGVFRQVNGEIQIVPQDGTYGDLEVLEITLADTDR